KLAGNNAIEFEINNTDAGSISEDGWSLGLAGTPRISSDQTFNSLEMLFVNGGFLNVSETADSVIKVSTTTFWELEIDVDTVTVNSDQLNINSQEINIQSDNFSVTNADGAVIGLDGKLKGSDLSGTSL